MACGLCGGEHIAMTGVSQSVGWTVLTQARAAPLVAVAVLSWVFLGPSSGGLTPAAATPARPIQEAEPAPFPMVAQTQPAPGTEPGRRIEAPPQTDLDRQRGEAARQAERDAAARAEQQIRRIEEAIFRQAAEEAAARKAASRRGETTVGQPDTARARPQDIEPVRRPAEAATVAPGSPALSIAPSSGADPSRSCQPLRRRRSPRRTSPGSGARPRSGCAAEDFSVRVAPIAGGWRLTSVPSAMSP